MRSTSPPFKAVPDITFDKAVYDMTLDVESLNVVMLIGYSRSFLIPLNLRKPTHYIRLDKRALKFKKYFWP